MYTKKHKWLLVSSTLPVIGVIWGWILNDIRNCLSMKTPIIVHQNNASSHISIPRSFRQNIQLRDPSPYWSDLGSNSFFAPSSKTNEVVNYLHTPRSGRFIQTYFGVTSIEVEKMLRKLIETYVNYVASRDEYIEKKTISVINICFFTIKL